MAPSYGVNRTYVPPLGKKMDRVFLVLLIGVLFVGIYVAASVIQIISFDSRLQQDMTKDHETAQSLEKKDTTIVLLAAVRNAMEGLPFTLENYRKIATCYPNTRCVFVENNSVDETRVFLETEFTTILPTKIINGKVDSKDQGNTQGKGAQRIKRMASLRNQLVDEVMISDEIVIVYDADWKVNVPIESFRKAVDYLVQNNEIQGVAPVLLKQNYFCPFVSVFHDTFAFKSDKTRDYTHCKKVCYLRTKMWNETDPIPVHSAFGCMAIYKNKDSGLPRYEAIPCPHDSNEFQCEHVGFNEKMGKMEILPWFKLHAP